MGPLLLIIIMTYNLSSIVSLKSSSDISNIRPGSLTVFNTNYLFYVRISLYSIQ
jgi:hypothetical protein